MGIVMRARDKNLDRDVALKVMRPDLLTYPAVLEAFFREARAMAKVRHPNVIEIYDLDQREGTTYFAMEYVEGTDLEDWLQEHPGPRPLDQALSILDPLCRGVHAIHEAGAAHRDLKPGNVMLGPSCRVAVADLGLSVFVDDPKLHRQLSGGTPEYMAPEVAAGSKPDPDLVNRVDIYALGCICYELLTGRRPFDGADPQAVMKAQVEQDPPAPGDLHPELPVEFDAPILRALAKDPTERTPSAEILRVELLAAREAAAQRVGRSTDDLNFLIVDDDPDMLEWLDLHLSLRFPAATIRHAKNGLVAMEAIDEQAPDLVITDLDMPGLDGAELTRHLRSTPGQETIPIIVVTAVGGAMDWARLQEIGASGFQVKPVDPEALAALIGRQLFDADS
jgi:serine/threonine-protein kinase